MERYNLDGNRAVAGSIDVEFSHGVYDTLLESLMQSSFTSNVLKTGTTRKSLTVEEAQADISQFRVYTGLIVDKLDMTIPTGGVITAKFDVLAKDQSALTGATIDTDATVTPAASSSPFTGYAASGFIKEAGSAVGYITSLQFTVDNGHAKNYAIGVNTIRDFTTGNSKISGTANVFFEDNVMYNKFVNSTLSSIDMKFVDADGATFEVLFPKIKYTGATKTINNNGPVTLAMPFMALYDSSTGSHVVMTRSA